MMGAEQREGQCILHGRPKVLEGLTEEVLFS